MTQSIIELKSKYAQEEREIQAKISRQLPSILENPSRFNWKKETNSMNSYVHHAPAYRHGEWTITEAWLGNLTEQARPAKLSYRGRDISISQEQVDNLLKAIK